MNCIEDSLYDAAKKVPETILLKYCVVLQFLQRRENSGLNYLKEVIFTQVVARD